ncbi:MAG: DUF3667 domain-containing protein [Armatimonadaceae bacterium]
MRLSLYKKPETDAVLPRTVFGAGENGAATPTTLSVASPDTNTEQHEASTESQANQANFQTESTHSCLNCGTSDLKTPFCPHCGQNRNHRTAPVGTLIHDVLEEFFKWDGRLLGTLGPLLFRPGKLSAEYVAGRRTRYLSPFRMFFVVSALFFFVLSLHNFADTADKSFSELEAAANRSTETASTGNGNFQIQFDGTIASTDSEKTSQKSTEGKTNEQVGGRIFQPKFGKTVSRPGRLVKDFEQWQVHPGNVKPVTGIEYRLFHGFLRMMDAPGRYVDKLQNSFAQAAFFLVPVYAALLALLYLRQRRFFVEHLVFAAHNHTFAFLLYLVVDSLLQLKIWQGAPALLLLYPVYEFLALRTFYKQGIGKTLFKQIILFHLYFLLLVLGLVGVAVLTMIME